MDSLTSPGALALTAPYLAVRIDFQTCSSPAAARGRGLQPRAASLSSFLPLRLLTSSSPHHPASLLSCLSTFTSTFHPSGQNRRRGGGVQSHHLRTSLGKQCSLVLWALPQAASETGFDPGSDRTGCGPRDQTTDPTPPQQWAMIYSLE